MTQHATLPEHANKPPPILTPQEDADRATRHADREEWRAEHGIASDPANPHDPLRQPGESSSKESGRRRRQDEDA